MYKCDSCHMILEKDDLDKKYPTTCPHCGEEALMKAKEVTEDGIRSGSNNWRVYISKC